MGGLPIKFLCDTLPHMSIVRRFKPIHSAISVFAGIVLTSVYQMDLTFDYNPRVTLLFVLIAYFLILAYESTSKRIANILIFGSGMISGVLIMTKQNVGLMAPVVAIIILYITKFCKPELKILKQIFLLIAGMVIAVIPGIAYLIFNGVLQDFIYCITSALKAKGVGNGFIITTLRNAWRPNYLAVAFLIMSFYFLIKKQRKINYKRVLTYLIAAVLLGGDYSIFSTPIWNFFNGNNHTELSSIIMLCIFLIIVFLIVVNIYVKKENSRIKLLSIFWIVIFVILLFSNMFLDPDQRNFLYGTLGMFNLRRGMLYVCLYIEIYLWFKKAEDIFIYKNIEDVSYFLFFTSVLLYLGISFTSALLEELYCILFIPPIVAEAFAAVTDHNKIKNQVIIFSCFTLGLMCSFEKSNMPYEWHSWRVPSLYDPDNPTVASSIKGLEGITLPKSDEEKYEEIISGINKYSTSNDIVYQFPNVMLFNVLTERKTIYEAIPYFDVCPDSEAIKSAEQLTEQPPEMVLWSSLNEGRWQVHEDAYRNGNPSGQRKIQDWFNSYVKNHYRRIGSWDNNEGEGDDISLWHRVAFAGGDASDTIELNSNNAYIFQLASFSKSEFCSYVFKLSADYPLTDQKVKVTLWDKNGNIVNKTTDKLKECENGYYSINANETINVTEGEGYIIEIEFLYLGYPVQLSRTTDGSATEIQHAFTDKNQYNFNICIYCE